MRSDKLDVGICDGPVIVRVVGGTASIATLAVALEDIWPIIWTGSASRYGYA